MRVRNLLALKSRAADIAALVKIAFNAQQISVDIQSIVIALRPAVATHRYQLVNHGFSHCLALHSLIQASLACALIIAYNAPIVNTFL